MSATTELAAVPPKETALTVYSAANGLDPWLGQIRAEVDKFLSVLPDLTTKKGRDLYASMAHKVAKSKTALDAVGKELSAQQKEVPKRIDAERKRVWDTLELWQKEVRKPLDDWEAAEERRIASIKDDIAKIAALAADLDGLTVAELESRIASAEWVIIADKWAEFQVDAALAKESALVTLNAALTTRQQYEAEQLELARLRKEKEDRDKKDHEDRIAREAAERATREAEEKAQRERDAEAQRVKDEQAAAEKRENDLKLVAAESERKAELAKREKVEAEQKAERDRLAAIESQKAAVEKAKQDEVDRQQAAADEIIRQQNLREADKAHRGKINREAMEAFIKGGMTEACAKQAVVLIASRVIPGVTIAY
jgi:hypothetical protein